jgi:exportin-2 (importin alpha re-exporter)
LKYREVVESDQLETLFGLFQKLIASKSNDPEGVYLLQSMVEFVPREALAPYISNIFALLFQHLTSSKTTKYVKSLLVFFSLFTIRYGVKLAIHLQRNVNQYLSCVVHEPYQLISLPDD